MKQITGIDLGLARDGQPQRILAPMANRHGLIAGATGTGKTVTLQTLAQNFSRAGVPVFTADVKGDLAGLAVPGELTPRLAARVLALKPAGFEPRACPTLFWDLWGRRGHAVRTTVSDMGPLLLARLLDLNDTQGYVLHLAFKLADDEGLLLLDLKDLRSLLAWIGNRASELRTTYGNVSPATVGSIQRNLLVLDEAGGSRFFGEPALRIEHLMQRDFSGHGVIGILDAGRLLSDSRLYSTFLLWLLAELFEQLPEVGDQDRPKLVFFFDEAHLLFRDTPRALVDKIEQVVRLIRSKGVGVYFVTQNPLDIPTEILAQLGHRVQHALRAFTPADQKVVRAVAETFRQSPGLDTERTLLELEVGEALVSVLDAKGRPSAVARTRIYPPESRMGSIEDERRAELLGRSPLSGVYDSAVDRESAYEILKQRAEQAAAPQPAPMPAAPEWAVKTPPPRRPSAEAKPREAKAAGRRRESVGEAVLKSTMRSMGSYVGRQLIRGLMGSLLGSRR